MNEEFSQYLELFYVAISENNFRNAVKQIEQLKGQIQLLETTQTDASAESLSERENEKEVYKEIVESCKLKIKSSLQDYLKNLVPKSLTILPGFWEAYNEYGSISELENYVKNSFVNDLSKKIHDIHIKLNNLIRLKQSQMTSSTKTIIDDDHVIISLIDSYYKYIITIILLFDTILQSPLSSSLIHTTLSSVNSIIENSYMNIFKHLEEIYMFQSIIDRYSSLLQSKFSTYPLYLSLYSRFLHVCRVQL